MTPQETAILQTVVLLLDDVSQYEIMKVGLLPYLDKAKEIANIIRNHKIVTTV